MGIRFGLFLILSVFASLSVGQQSSEKQGEFIRLVAALDEPEFYCFDLAGWGANVLLDEPMQTHTCKNRNADDEMFSIEGEQIKATMYDRCIQVAGSSGTTLPGSAILVKPCSDNALQKLSLNEDGKIHIIGTDYCIGVGPDSRAAGGPSHMWRTLQAVVCDSAEPELVTWQYGL